MKHDAECSCSPVLGESDMLQVCQAQPQSGEHEPSSYNWYLHVTVSRELSHGEVYNVTWSIL